MLLNSDSETHTAHPDLEELLLLQSGELQTEQADALLAHVEACPTCRKRIDSTENLYGRVARAGSREALREPAASKRAWRTGAGIATGLLVSMAIVAAVRFSGPVAVVEPSPPPAVETDPQASTQLDPPVLQETNAVEPPTAAVVDPLDQAEAGARLALHAAGLDSSTLVAVDRTPAGVRIWGVVSTGETRQSLASALAQKPSVEIAVRTETEHQLDPQPLPWTSFQGDAPPLAADRLQDLYPTNSPERQQLQNTLDRLTRELVGLAYARQGLLDLSGEPGVDAVAVQRAADDIAVQITQRTAAVSQSLQPLLGPTAGAGGSFAPAAADRLYLLVHDLVFLSRGGASVSLEATVSEIRSILDRA